MPADSTHPLYDDCVDAWQMVRDCLAGSRRIKGAAETYLPRLHEQGDVAYEAYKERANFFNALKRTLQAFVGFIFRNNPEQMTPDSMAQFMRDATMTGKSFYDLEKEVVREVMSVGKCGTLIDWKLIPENRPFCILYKAEDIINWKYKRVQGRTILSMITFREMSQEWISLNPGETEPDEFEHQTYEQFRTYEVIQDGEGRPYVNVTVRRKKFAELKRKTASANPIPAEFVVVDEQIPTRKGFPLTFIPFVVHGSEVNELETVEVPLESIADINISHYRTSADLENALHIAGVPTPIAAGFGGDEEDEEEEFYLGTSKAWVTDKPEAKAYFLAYDANMVAPLVTAMERKEGQMASLGARMLEKQGQSGGGRQEAYQTVQVRQSGDHSALMSGTIACTQSLSDVLQIVNWWMDRTVENPEDLDDKVQTELNTDFIQMMMDSPMLQALWNVYIGGGLSYDALFLLFQKGGLISSERDMKEEIAAIMNDPVRLAELERQAAADAALAKTQQQQQPPDGGGGAGA